MGRPEQPLTLERHDPDWYVIQGGGNGASVEGDADEWLDIARGLEMAEARSHTRCGLRWTDSGAELYSPRNSCGDRDHAKVKAPGSFAKHIREVVETHATEDREHLRERVGELYRERDTARLALKPFSEWAATLPEGLKDDAQLEVVTSAGRHVAFIPVEQVRKAAAAVED